MNLFRSDNVDQTNFDSEEFKFLFQKEILHVDNYLWTSLMYLCRYNPQLLN